MGTTALTVPAPKPVMPIKKRLVVGLALLVVLAVPGVVAGLAFHPQAAGAVVLGCIVGMMTVVQGGRKVGYFATAALILLTPLAIVGGAVPIAGAALMALTCFGAGVSAAWGLHTGFIGIPLVMAFLLINPPTISSVAPDRDSTPYLVAMMVLIGFGSLWIVIIMPILLRKTAAPSLKSNSRSDTIEYTIIITVLCSFGTFAVLFLGLNAHGAWLIITLIVIVQLGPQRTLRMTVSRVGGTLAGALLAALVIAVVPSSSVQLGIGLVTLFAALIARLGPSYWLFVVFLTPTIILLTASGDAAEVTEQRVLYTVAAGAMVLTAGAIVLVYQRMVLARRGHSGTAAVADVTG